MVRRLVGFLLIFIIAFPLWCTARIWWTGTHSKAERSDAIVVLGAAQFNGRPSPVLEARLRTAITVYEARYATRIITVGAGAPGDRTTEAAASKSWLVDAGVPNDAVTALAQGRDTLQSIVVVQRYLRANHLRTILIVTDAWHCLRAETMARDHGLIPSCAPVTSGSTKILDGSNARFLIRETGAYLSYVTLGRLGIQLSDRGSSVAL